MDAAVGPKPSAKGSASFNGTHSFCPTLNQLLSGKDMGELGLLLRAQAAILFKPHFLWQIRCRCLHPRSGGDLEGSKCAGWYVDLVLSCMGVGTDSSTLSSKTMEPPEAMTRIFELSVDRSEGVREGNLFATISVSPLPDGLLPEAPRSVSQASLLEVSELNSILGFLFPMWGLLGPRSRV